MVYRYNITVLLVDLARRLAVRGEEDTLQHLRLTMYLLLLALPSFSDCIHVRSINLESRSRSNKVVTFSGVLSSLLLMNQQMPTWCVPHKLLYFMVMNPLCVQEDVNLHSATRGTLPDIYVFR